MVINGKFDADGFPFIDLVVMNKQKGLVAGVKAIIDTGAAHCMIQEVLATHLELEILRTADYRHPVYGKMPLKEYLMDLRFTHEDQVIVNFEKVRAGTLVDSQYPASVILGVELLKYAQLSYDGPAQIITLQFP